MTIAVDCLQAGECLRVKTPTATYFLLMLGNLVASVYRMGDGEPNARLIEKRRMSNRLDLHTGFKMFNENNEPLSVIIPIEVALVSPDTIPLRHEE